MKQTIFLFATIFWGTTLLAQDAKPVIIISTNGNVSLISNGKKKARPVQAGAVALNTSQLKLSPDASAIVYCGSQFKEVKGAEKTPLSSLCGDEPSARREDADFHFGEKVMAAVEMMAGARKQGDGWSNAVTDPKKSGDGWGAAVTDPKKSGDGWGTAVTDPKKSGDGWNNAVTDPKKSGDGWGNAVTDPKKSGDGWGGKGSSIRLIMPFKKVKAMPTVFSWSKPANTEPYQLSILDESEKTIHTVTVRDTFATVDLSALGLSPEKIYHWKITVGGSKPMSSNALDFGIGSEEEWAETMTKAADSGLSGNSENLKLLVEAIALENDDWLYAAQQIYARLQTQKTDNLTRMMHSAFWMRYGFRRLAEKAARN